MLEDSHKYKIIRRVISRPQVIPKRPLQPQTACRHGMDNLLLSGKKIISRTNFRFMSNYNCTVESTLLENVSLVYTRRVEARKDGLQMIYIHGTTHTHTHIIQMQTPTHRGTNIINLSTTGFDGD